MTRIMKVKTNASTMLVAYEVQEQRVWIKDWTSWIRFDGVEDVEAWMGVDANDSEAPVIVDEIEF